MSSRGNNTHGEPVEPTIDGELRQFFDAEARIAELVDEDERLTNEQFLEVAVALRSMHMGPDRFGLEVGDEDLLSIVQSRDFESSIYEYCEKVEDISLMLRMVDGPEFTDHPSDLAQIQEIFDRVVSYFPPTAAATEAQLEERDLWTNAMFEILGRPDIFNDIELGSASANDLLDSLALEHSELSIDESNDLLIQKGVKSFLVDEFIKRFGEHDATKAVVFEIYLQARLLNLGTITEWDEIGLHQRLETTNYPKISDEELMMFIAFTDGTIDRLRQHYNR